jgi:antitoxin ParD1/3/4
MMIMARLERITVTMPEEMAAKLRAAVESGEYATTSEIVREALRDWEEYQGLKGPFRPADDFFDELEAKLQQRIDSEQKSAA